MKNPNSESVGKPNSWNRRHFLQASGALAAASWSHAMGAPILFQKKKSVPRTLILVELKGGNDGLSTVIPLADPEYRRARRTALVLPDEALILDEKHGFNPRLEKLAAAYKDKQVAIIEGVGVPGGVRSHFKATDIWHSADPVRAGAAPGWVANLGEHAWKDRGADAVVHFGSSPLRAHFSGSRAPLVVENPDHFATLGEGPKGAASKASKKGKKKQRDSGNPALDRIRGISEQARKQSLRVRGATAEYRTPVAYPGSAIGSSLRDVAALLNVPDGGAPRVLSAALGGFDTHARQKNAHDRQMTLLDGALGALIEDLGRTAIGQQAVVVVYSEFGRRVNENGSQGTDHGKAGPVLVLGHEIKPGMFGYAPSLKDLDDGDLFVTTDFRQVYATLIEGVFDQDSRALLGAPFENLGFLG